MSQKECLNIRINDTMKVLLINYLILFTLLLNGQDSLLVDNEKSNPTNVNHKEIVFENKVFIEVSEDSDVFPPADLWEDELERYGFKYVKSKDQAKWIFKFRFKNALGDCMVAVTVYDAKQEKELWQSKKFRGTISIQNDISPMSNGITKCFEKGLVPALEAEKF